MQGDVTTGDGFCVGSGGEANFGNLMLVLGGNGEPNFDNLISVGSVSGKPPLGNLMSVIGGIGSPHLVNVMLVVGGNWGGDPHAGNLAWRVWSSGKPRFGTRMLMGEASGECALCQPHVRS